ncbi:hypothetical protein GLOIN_2v1482698 [Rhizophagus clarus]|uniref:Uncharacterized protein n=1 Tax=Rhizophagus clarus TaxID=94130 RepID=A0A8H3MFS7_9GLOM|nr:hypothetical protein GLOIN_2v1482698 [Rhizophagus clarus]
MHGHEELLNELGINEAEVGFNHWISLLSNSIDYVDSDGRKFPLINPINVLSEPREGCKILGIYTDFNKGETQKKQHQGMTTANVTRTRSKLVKKKKNYLYSRC